MTSPARAATASTRSPTARRAVGTGHRVYLGAGLIASVAILALPHGLLRDAAYEAIGASAVVAILVGTRRNRPSTPVAWYLLAAATAMWVLGDAIFSWYQDVQGLDPSLSIADAVYLPAYGVIAAALLVLFARSSTRRSSTALVDSALVTAAAGLLWWVFVVGPTWSSAEGSTLARLVAAAYPVGDILLFAVLVRVTWRRSRPTAAGTSLALAFVLLLAADALYDVSTFVPAVAAKVDSLDALWLASYVLWGAAALHPSMTALSDPVERPPAPVRAREVGGIAAVSLTGPGLIAWELATGRPLHLWAAIVVGIAMIGLVTLRIVHMVRDLQEHARRLDRLAGTDFVTGLMNRQRFTEHLRETLASARTRTTGLLLVDLERFTEINNVLGHQTGDAILRGVGDRLVEMAGDQGVVARMGGDTFAVLCRRISSGTDVLPVASSVLSSLNRPYELPGVTVAVEARIGALLLTDRVVDAEAALSWVDAAASAARSRPDRIAEYDERSTAAEERASLLAGELPRALANGELVLHYQPQVRIRDGRVLSVEALARWQHPFYGLLGPDSFIAAAEQTGLIGPLTHQVLDLALAQCVRWNQAGHPLTVAVNLSVRNLLDPHLVAEVEAALGRHGLPASSLELEITESPAMVDPRRSMRALEGLDGLGVTLSVDDFGTGHSSLGYLHQLPVRRLKIDRSFVTDLLTDPVSEAIVRSTIELAEALHLDVVAEGVEDDATLLRLRDLRCSSAQGFGIGRPVPADLVPALVTQIERRLPPVLAGTLPTSRRGPGPAVPEHVASA
jgi:diguanylate cyclase (GGDEF)-like protein